MSFDGKDTKIIVEAVLDRIKSEQNINKILNNIKVDPKIVELQIDDKKLKRALTRSLKDIERSQDLEQNLKVFESRINKWVNANSKVLTVNKAQVEDFKARLKSIDTATDFKNLKREWSMFTNQMSAADRVGRNLFDGLKDDAEKFTKWLLASGGVMTLVNSLKQMNRSVKDIDKSMTELKKVTEETDKTYNAFLDRTSKKAVQLGTKISDLVNATADFARLGYSLEEAEELGRVATIYKNVADGIENVEQATSSIISTMKAFNIEAKDSEHIINAFNEVGNNFAISATGIGESLKRSASSLAAANNTFEESIGLITAANTVVQDPAVVGTAMKTISARLRNTAGDLQDMGEDAEYAAESITQLQQSILRLTKGRVDIMADENTFKSTYDIVVELSRVWDDLSDKAQADITRLVAGVRQSNVFTAMVKNIGEGIKATESALGSEGSAITEYEKWLQSIEGKTYQFQAQFEALSNAVINSEFVGMSIDSGRGLLGLLTAIIEKLGMFPILAGTISAAFSVRKDAGKVYARTA